MMSFLPWGIWMVVEQDGSIGRCDELGAHSFHPSSHEKMMKARAVHQPSSKRLIVYALLVVSLAGVSSFLISTEDPAHPEVPLPEISSGSRWVKIDGASNTRDIGGYRTTDGHTVRWGILYRSGQLSELTAAGCQQFQALGIQRVVDFRNRLLPSPLFGGDVQCVFDLSAMSLLPVGGKEAPEKSVAYIQSVRDSAESYRKAFELIYDRRNLPLMYHCAGGKDRSGIMTALLLTLAGVDRQTIVDDYLLSTSDPAHADTSAMTNLLDEIDRQGGIEIYLDGIGVTPRMQRSIRDTLVK
jgi:Tyrosine phosphatase family